MLRYTIRRILQLVPIMLGISLLVFILLNVVPGDPVASLFDPKSTTSDPEVIARVRKQWGLDDPLHVQYFRWLGNLVKGDMGISIQTRQSVSLEIWRRFPATVRLSVAAMVYAVAVGVGLGILAGVKRNSWFDTGSMGFALFGVSAPVFWLGLMLMLVFAVKLKWLPPSGYGNGQFKYLILPAITLGMAVTAIIARVTRSAMLNVVSQDYIRTARAKGLNERLIVYRHALKNALIPVITIVGIQVGNLLAGAVVTETVFNWPGIGQMAYRAILQRDRPLVQGVIVFFVVIFALVNLIVDLTYAWVDPRIRYT